MAAALGARKPRPGWRSFTAILRSYQLLADEVNRVMRGHDLTFARYEVLTWLATDPESSLTLSWISKTLRIPPATVTNIIDRLEKDKLVRRVAAPVRCAHDAGRDHRRVAARSRERATDDLNATVYERIGLSEEQRSELTDLLAELRASGNEFDVERSDEVIEEVGSGTRRSRPAAGQES